MIPRPPAQPHRLRSREHRTVPSPRAPESRAWDVRPSPSGAVVTTSGRPLAEGRVEDAGDRVVVHFWTSPGLPPQLRVRLVGLTFGHPALRPRRPVLVCVPAGDSEVLTEARAHLAGARSRIAGATCLVEGQLGSTTRTSSTGRRPLATPGSAVVG